MALDGQLDVGVSPEAVEFTFSVTNVGDEPMTLRFRSGLAADIAVYRGDAELWRWSDGRLFTQALWSETLAPGESLTHEAAWPDPGPGNYEAVGRLEAENAEVEASAAFTV